MKKYGRFETQSKEVPAKTPKLKNNLLQTYFVSLLCMVMSVTMFFGTSFAWFTSEVNNAGNEIYIGTLDVNLDKKTGENTWESLSAPANTANTPKLFDDQIRWEPGYTMMETVRVTNQGDLAFKYELTFTDGTLDGKTVDESAQGLKEIGKNFEVWAYDHKNGTPNPTKYADISENNGWYKAGTLADVLAGKAVFAGTMEENDVFDNTNRGVKKTAHTYTIALHMSESATGEDLMGKKISLNVKLVAYQKASEKDAYGDAYDAITAVHDAKELAAALAQGGNIVLANDFVVTEMITIPAGVSVTLDMNGKTISTDADPMIALKENSSLVIDGNGTFDLNKTGANLLWPQKDSNATIIIKSGNFLRDQGTDVSNYGFPFVVGESSCTLIIEGGYFDGGYYAAGDCEGICKSNLNLSTNQYVRVYGGTFVGQNPAWGDEGKAAFCPHCDTNGSGCQGVFLEGQTTTSTELPAGYTIVEGTTENGRPTYTVTYEAPNTNE